MDKKQIVIAIIRILQNYLEGKSSAKEMIENYDEFMREYFDYESDDQQLVMIDDFQTELALFVEDSEKRKDHRDYYGEEELTKKVKEFLQAIWE